MSADACARAQQHPAAEELACACHAAADALRLRTPQRRALNAAPPPLLLPQVYNFEAREKVRKDEEAAAAAEAALAERGLAAERAARRATLLDRASKRKRADGEAEAAEDDAAPAAERHINFFAEMEARGPRLRRCVAAAELCCRF